jgi:tRNA 2-thiouridine synthesizing protein A
MTTSTSNKSPDTKTIDVRGLFCPEPVFRTKIEIERLAIGDTLKIVADDPESEEDISKWYIEPVMNFYLLTRVKKILSL